MMRALVVVFTILTFSVPAMADAYGVGDEVKGFALKAVNSDVIGEKVVAIDNYFGEKATDPKKAVVLSFFATYCEPCKREMPFLAAMHDEYGEKGLSVMSVSIDKEPDKIEFVKTLAAENNVKFPVLTDRFNIVAKRYYVEKLPLVYVINGDGKVAMVKTGYTDDATSTIFNAVRRLVGEPTSNPVPASISAHMPESAVAAAVETPEEPVEATEAATSVEDPEAAAAAAAEEEEKKKKKKKRRKRRRKKK